MKREKSSIRLLSIILVVIMAFSVVTAFAGCEDIQEALKEYTVTYELDDGTNHPDNPAKYTLYDLPLTIKEAAKTDYIFLGWTSELNTELQLTVRIPWNTKKDLTFTAHWQEIPEINDEEFVLIYLLDGGTNHADNPDKYTAADLPLTIKEATRVDYEFLGWTCELNSEMLLIVEIPEGTEMNLTFTACWESIEEIEADDYKNDKRKAPDFTLYTLDGKAVSLSDYYGVKPVFVSFWAYWCGPCLTEMKNVFNPLYNEMLEEMPDEFELLAVHIDKLSSLKTHLKTNSYTFPILDDSSQTAISKGYSTGYIPSNYMVDKWGYLYKSSITGTADAVTDFNLSTMSSISSMKEIINGAIARAGKKKL